MKFSVLGLGPSLSEFAHMDGLTIGVNDIYSKHPTDYLVCIDRPHGFEPERLKWIKAARPKVMFSHLDEWRPHFICFEHLNFAPGRCTLEHLDSDRIVKSNNSTFVAAVLAYRMGAKEIWMYGADFKNHHQLSKPNVLKHTLGNFKQLYDALQKRGVKMYSSKGSLLSEFIPGFPR